MGQVRDAEGVVLRADRAGALVDAPGTAAGEVRACWGGALLAAIAADPGAVPRAGDVVAWREWPDGRLTVERVRRRGLRPAGPAPGAG